MQIYFSVRGKKSEDGYSWRGRYFILSWIPAGVTPRESRNRNDDTPQPSSFPEFSPENSKGIYLAKSDVGFFSIERKKPPDFLHSGFPYNFFF
jgi:hypothetical protein